MKLYLTTIGEKTKDIAIWNCERLGYDVEVLDKQEDWIDKYKRFIKLANGECLRCDADVLINKNAINIKSGDMAQGKVFDFYKNDISIGQPTYYSDKAIEFLKENIDVLREDRPETSAWRYLENNKFKVITSDTVCGMHGFFQRYRGIRRAKQHKDDRGQIDQFDFELVEKIMEDL